MTDLHDLLDRAAGTDDSTDHLSGDLRRGRRALRRRRTTHTATALAGVAAVGALGYALAPRGPSTGNEVPRPSASGSAPAAESSPPTSTAQLTLVASNEQTAAFRFGRLPKGWQVWEEDSSFVQITEGGADGGQNWLDDLIVMYEAQALHIGEKVQHKGRTFWVQHRPHEDHDAVHVETRPGDPAGGITVQFPQSAGFTDQQMLELAASVEVLPGAVALAG